MKCKSKSESYFDEFRESISDFSKSRDAAYENCNLPNFLYWHLLSGLCHPLCRIEMPYKKYGRHYDAAYRLRQLAGDKIRSIILKQLYETVHGLFTIPSRRDRWTYRQFNPDNMDQMVNSAARILEFSERFMITPVEISNSYLSSIETEMDNAILRGSYTDFALWWAVWTLTKAQGSLDNSYWEEFGRMDNRMKFDWLQKTYHKLTFRDRDGNFKYEVFGNPTLFSMNWDRPAQAMEVAMLNLEPFIRGEQQEKAGLEQ